MISADAALDALGNPTRRAILSLLASEPRSVAALARPLPISRPAVSQHLRILEEAGLVSFELQGRQSIYRLRPEGFVAARAWLDAFWPDALSRFAALAESSWEQR